jgi:tRNA nucleotidyltransferase (CCA-adding enzyme)
VDIYLVGGAVRDQLLGLPVTERDWVVVGADDDTMTRLGFRQVGKDFPVYLHPDTQEEYALARTERKSGQGHRGFETRSGPGVTLEQDLARRDLTINAMAMDETGHIVDPYGGQRDLRARRLRHVSAAFSEDPLRVLRAARFAARFTGFTIAGDTFELMARMVQSGELQTLPAERVFMETNKALATDSPRTFFEVLKELGANEVLWPELLASNIAGLARWTTDHEPMHAFVILLCRLPLADIERFAARLKAPGDYRDMALLASRFLGAWQAGSHLGTGDILEWLYDLDALRRPERFRTLCGLMAAFTHGSADSDQPDDRWLEYLSTAMQVTARDVGSQLRGPAIGEAIKTRQREALEQIR